MMKKIGIVLGIVLVVCLIGFFYFFQGSQSSSKTATTEIVTTKQKSFSLAEISTHNNINDCWLVIEGKVYDVTTFIPDHPGGTEILKGCGRDATGLFNGQRDHQEGNAASYLPTFLIGVVK